MTRSPTTVRSGRIVAIGIDVGGTKVAGGFVSRQNEVFGDRVRPTQVDGARDPGLQVTLALAEELAAEARDRGLVLEGIGAGFPEYVDPSGRLTSHEVLAWSDQPAELLAHLGPLTIESDVRCAALGEGAVGAARGLDDYAFVNVGTGLSYTLVQGGRARRGARGEAIAFGELEVSSALSSRDPTTLERFASGEAIRSRFSELKRSDASDAVEVFSRAEAGDPEAIGVVRSAGQALGEGLAVLVTLLDPSAVVIGGGVTRAVTRAAGPWRSALCEAYDARLARRRGPPPIVWGTLGGAAGIVGAAIAHRLETGGRQGGLPDRRQGPPIAQAAAEAPQVAEGPA